MSSATVVALHGFTGASDSFEKLKLQKRGYQVIAPYLTGHGPSPDLSSRNFEDEVARIATLAERFPAPRHLLGYSMGARVALGLGLDYPSLFRSLTLIGVNPGLDDQQAREARRAWEERWIGVLEQDGLAVFEYHWSRLPLFSSQQRLSGVELQRQKETRLRHSARGLGHALEVLGLSRMPDFWPRLSLLRCPVRIVTGSEDAKFQAIAQQMARLMPQAQVVIVDSAGHNALLEAPDDVGEALDACVREADADARRERP